MHQIRYFLAVARVLNFTRAAEECHVAQPSLTRAIKLLEAELGADLFRRERNLTHLTDFGNRMLPLLQQCYESAVSAKRLATSFKSGAVASLTLALSRTVPIALLVAPLKELVRAFPTLELKFLRGTSAEVAENLKKGEAMLAIAGPLGESWERLDAWPLFCEGFHALVHPEHPLAGANQIRLADLNRDRLLARPYCELYQALDERFREEVAGSAGRHELGSDEDLINLVEANLGIGILPKSTPLPAGLRTLSIEGLDLNRTISLYGVSGRERSAPASALMRLLRARDWSQALN
jgi:DNA-binding transcriptional LysR family regulator